MKWERALKPYKIKGFKALFSFFAVKLKIHYQCLPSIAFYVNGKSFPINNEFYCKIVAELWQINSDTVLRFNHHIIGASFLSLIRLSISCLSSCRYIRLILLVFHHNKQLYIYSLFLISFHLSPASIVFK